MSDADAEAAAARRELDAVLQARYQPLSTQRRWLVLVLAVATALTVIWTMLDPVARAKRLQAAAAAASSQQQHQQQPPVAQQPAVCAAGQTSGCVGGRAEVILLPAAAASAGRPAAAATGRGVP